MDKWSNQTAAIFIIMLCWVCRLYCIIFLGYYYNKKNYNMNNHVILGV